MGGGVCTTPSPSRRGKGGRGIRRRRSKKMKLCSSNDKNTHSPQKFSINNIVSTLKDNCIDKWRPKLENSEKSHFYKEIRTKYEPEGCLSSQSNISFRKKLTKLRINIHEPMIERDRYPSPKIPREKRLCQICQNQVEDEKHFPFKCRFYDVDRKNPRTVV